MTEGNDVYLVFCGPIDQGAGQKFTAALARASQNPAANIHLAIHSSGGLIADGVFLYNLFQASTIPVTVYNIGTVQSAALLVYLGASHRKTSALATFMAHRVSGPAIAATASQLKSITQLVDLEQDRNDSIIRKHTRLTEDTWKLMVSHEVWWNGTDAVGAGIADGLGDFAPPKGYPIYTL